MSIRGIKYIAPCLDNSGYAKAARGYILALHNLGVPITVSPVSFEKIQPDLGHDGEVLKSLLNKDIEYDTVIMHTTPEFWHKFKEEGKLNVGYTIWETTRLHPDWSGYINAHADAVFVGCSWNIEVFKRSGVTIPVVAIPHAIPLDDGDAAIPYNIKGIGDNTYIFYSIFQWTERKDPISLLKAYWHAFNKEDNVALVIKSYRSDYSEAEKEAIRLTIKRLKEVTVLDYYPPVYFIPNMLTEDEIRGLHARGDCYVSLDRGEGFGIPHFTAGAYGKPVIATGFGGVNEYLTSDNSYIVNYTLTPVHGMPWSPWYRADQLWAQVDVYEASKIMRSVYTHPQEAKHKGKLLQANIRTNFSDATIGKNMLATLNSFI